MNLSAILCRAQAVIHRERAAASSLENVRTIAERAAAVWDQQALSAERREARFARERIVAKSRVEQRQLDAAIALLDRAPEFAAD